MPLQGPGLGLQISSEYFLSKALQKNINFHCLGEKIHAIFWRLRIAHVCISAYIIVGC